MSMSIPTKGISNTKIDNDALKVLRRLTRFGHVAYLVGGCVRDLLLKLEPKDFDVATSAKPPEIRKIFRNCRLIGRRFRLAHIHFSNKVIETATFRAHAGEQTDEDLLIRSDNVFGTEQEDALRRDFTINALFYDPQSRTLIDHVGGLEDLVERTIRFIGKPDVRTREDPVRILRAIKFAARLDFSIEPATFKAIVRYRSHLAKSARPRLLEEIYRMLRSGAALASFRLMWDTGILSEILPEVASYLARAPERGEEREPGSGLFAYLKQIDRSERDFLSNRVLLASVLLHPVSDAIGKGRRAYGIQPDSDAPGEVVRQILVRMIDRLNLPKWQAERIQQLVASQKRLFNLHRNAPLPRGLLRRNYFPEALDLFEIGVRATGKGRHTLTRLRKVFQPGESIVEKTKPRRSSSSRGRRQKPQQVKKSSGRNANKKSRPRRRGKKHNTESSGS
ncbi:MAG: polynucleotide adenylyltransferase PcnB [Deltaproteobacteria bacterium]|nr:polynucleotide adenylyltransferase PcnB [Deltaproteobacteria bacterium]